MRRRISALILAVAFGALGAPTAAQNDQGQDFGSVSSFGDDRSEAFYLQGGDYLTLLGLEGECSMHAAIQALDDSRQETMQIPIGHQRLSVPAGRYVLWGFALDDAICDWTAAIIPMAWLREPEEDGALPGWAVASMPGWLVDALPGWVVGGGDVWCAAAGAAVSTIASRLPNPVWVALAQAMVAAATELCAGD
jgi:hypothetical protein